MNIRDLDYFVRLSQVKHFSKVAKEFHVSQPTITFAVKRLEKEMDCQLMYRHHTSALEVTNDGKQFLKHAKAILNHYHLAKLEIKDMNQDHMVIGLPPLIENNYFMPIAKRLDQAGLLNKIQTIEAGSETTLKLLNEGKVDVALLGLVNPMDQSEIINEKFDEQPLRIYVSEKNPLAKQKAVYFADLKNEDFVQFKKGFVHNYAFHLLCKRNGINPPVIFRSDEMTTISNMIANDIGIGFFTPLIPINHDRIVSIPLKDSDVPIFNVSIAYRKSHYFNDWQQKVIDCIDQGIKDFESEH